MRTPFTVSEVRRAEASDLEAVTDLTTRAFEPWVSVIGRRPAPMDADQRALISSGCVFLIDIDGFVGGAVVLVPSADALIVESVAVHPERQRLGLGRRLLAFAETIAREHELHAVRLFTHARMTSNINLYQRLGYAIIGKQPIPGGGHLVHMRKALDGENAWTS